MARDNACAAWEGGTINDVWCEGARIIGFSEAQAAAVRARHAHAVRSIVEATSKACCDSAPDAPSRSAVSDAALLGRTAAITAVVTLASIAVALL